MLLIFIAGCIGVALGSESDAEVASLIGKWQILDERLEGIGMVIVWEFTASEVIVRDEKTGDEVSRSRYTIDTTKSPHWITVEVDDSPREDSGDRRLGIYQIQDGNLHLKQEITDAGERPTSFDERFSRFKRVPQNKKAEQDGGGQPATRPESKMTLLIPTFSPVAEWRSR